MMTLKTSDELQQSNEFVKISAHVERLRTHLKQACEKLALNLSPQQQHTLLLYLDKLLLWNKAYNLTAINDPQEALIKHIFDCLAIVPKLPYDKLVLSSDFEGADILDIGTGAGLPSVVLAICQPERINVALDSNQKKIRFIRQMVSELGLNNLKPVAKRIEQHQGQYALITSRAFASLQDFVNLASPYLAQGGRLVAMKGKIPDEELPLLADDWHFICHQLDVPDLTNSRHLIELWQKND